MDFQVIADWLVHPAQATPATSTVIDAVGSGVDTGLNTVNTLIGNNLVSILVVAGLLLGIFVIWRLFRRMVR